MQYNLIQHFIDKKKLSQLWLSRQIGVTPHTICSWCNQKKQPSLDNLFKIADVLEINVKKLISDNPNYPSLEVIEEIVQNKEMWLIPSFVRLLNEAVEKRLITPGQLQEFKKFISTKIEVRKN